MTKTVDHYQDSYWNDLPAVLAYQCQRSTGNPDLWWMDYFKQRYAIRPFKRGLIIACGNGWVERSLIDRGIAEHFDAFDSAEHYLKEAEAQKGNRSIRYFQSGFATFQADERYDLIVNVAALHHAQYLYRHLSRLTSALAPEGVFVHWEYVGPSRNQYSVDHVARMAAVNQSLPARFRTAHALRPGLLGAVRGDPTEAIHSAEIKGAVGDYFDLLECRDLGGGIAYQILWNNTAEFARDDAEARDSLATLIQKDDEMTRSGTVPNLFSFLVYGPRRSKGWSAALRRQIWQYLIEPARELLARFTLGLYPGELLGAAVRRLRRQP